MKSDGRAQAPLPSVQRAVRHWKVRDPGEEDMASLGEAASVPPLVARLLLNRGISSADDAKAWLHGSLKDLPDPRRMVDMDKTVDRLVQALQGGERICIHGDYDVDGCTSTVLLVDFLRDLGGDVEWYAPHRERDGYGIQTATMRRLAEGGARVVVTCDNGTSAHEAIEAGNALGVDTLVCDHHTLPDALPSAFSILNPKRDGDGNPYMEMAAVGIAFMLAVAIRARLRESGFFAHRAEPDLRRYLDIVALGTVADMAPLRGVNRLLVRSGLRVLERRERPGIRGLLEVSGIAADAPLEASHLGFRLGPRINAAGRMDESRRAVDLLLASDDQLARTTARDLDAFNRRRQEIQREIFADVLRQAEREGDFHERKGLVLWSEKWHPGVVGIVASKVVRYFHRPALILALRDGVATGSGRAISGIDLVGALRPYRHLMERFGGHRAAVGLTVRQENLSALRAAFAGEAFADDDDPDVWTARLSVDAEIPLSMASWGTYEAIQRLGPFGMGNPEPVFAARGLRATGVRALPKDGIRMQLAQSGVDALPAVGFGLGVLPEQIRGPVDVAFHLQENRWRGRRTLELHLRDVRASDPEIGP